MTEDPVRDLTQLRSQFLALRSALAVNDVTAIDAATAALRHALGSLPSHSSLPADAQSLVRDIAALSGEVEATLASRLQAFDLVIEALRAEEGTRP
jgi:hypothetical protein